MSTDTPPPSVPMLEEVEALRKKYTTAELGQLCDLLQAGKVSELSAEIENIEALMEAVKDECRFHRAWIQHARNNPTMTLTALLSGISSTSFPQSGKGVNN